MSTPFLTHEKVHGIYRACLSNGFDDTKSCKTVELNKKRVAMSEFRLRINTPIIRDMLLQLPESFLETIDEKGAPISKATIDKNGRLWTILFSYVEELCMLGLGIGMVKIVPAETGNPRQINIVINQQHGRC
ncbi:MAG: hypothetical protein A2469_01400 [Candidatus Magasanikbacteria bacterium RIFOXYC2_FULL_40_16]|uniref:Uncharacterized protein n=3 Tax=Candidatus Magasanikiibacteriota TaxID=1752731 RepID=A0A1F6NDN9_9BACT|nr:MAG: hypothetical protein A2224_01525 [Candidatus Magasanikbacteria bacterium RIFOXYA2_FULL_40_20]OGH81930.1 MAG: hypothetical protein A2373_04450 [Candidatus Magasanikbacteria bacterium RIFOXYB1_FULL_40_15]OGH86838.1 MAG: hypothetical protein A2301_02195 [Candidatus Magasanikbacteria bacterium RIFOXYB2_FULL_40_13]OGH87697.1 MAG: hypothetical protein A2206_00495 [Candidatus Magasanikbacteria bacterium RIFOXYA1_FULL_40_8]OGH90414.1 MAG: hypothetical protein A2469_01400 [Candidatus Magasanikba